MDIYNRTVARLGSFWLTIRSDVTDAEAAPNTTLAVSATFNSVPFTFNVLPIFPTAGGAAPGALTDTWTMTVVGTPSETF